MQLNAISRLNTYFGKKRIGSTLKQLYLLKFQKLFSCVAFQHFVKKEQKIFIRIAEKNL